MNLAYRVDEYTAGEYYLYIYTDDTIILYTVDKTIIIRFRRCMIPVGICNIAELHPVTINSVNITGSIWSITHSIVIDD